MSAIAILEEPPEKFDARAYFLADRDFPRRLWVEEHLELSRNNRYYVPYASDGDYADFEEQANCEHFDQEYGFLERIGGRIGIDLDNIDSLADIEDDVWERFEQDVEYASQGNCLDEDRAYDLRVKAEEVWWADSYEDLIKALRQQDWMQDPEYQWLLHLVGQIDADDAERLAASVDMYAEPEEGGVYLRLEDVAKKLTPERLIKYFEEKESVDLQALQREWAGLKSSAWSSQTGVGALFHEMMANALRQYPDLEAKWNLLGPQEVRAFFDWVLANAREHPVGGEYPAWFLREPTYYEKNQPVQWVLMYPMGRSDWARMDNSERNEHITGSMEQFVDDYALPALKAETYRTPKEHPELRFKDTIRVGQPLEKPQAVPVAQQQQEARWRLPTEDELKPFVAQEECTECAEAIHQKWPFLRVQYGFFLQDTGYPADHAWTVAPDGVIVDTTAGQFGLKTPYIVPHNPDYPRYVAYDREFARAKRHEKTWDLIGRMTPEQRAKWGVDPSVAESEEAKAVEKEADKAEAPKSAEEAKAGNYEKGHVRLHGLEITIENAKGSVRKSLDPDNPWEVTMPAAYGYLRGVQGKDGDHMDVYIGDDPERENVYIVNQHKEKDGFDEHVVMLGFGSKEQAVETYDRAWEDGLGPKLRHSVVATNVDKLKHWLEHGDLKAEFPAKVEEAEARPLNARLEHLPPERLAFSDTGGCDLDKVERLKQAMRERGFDARYPLFCTCKNGNYLLENGGHRWLAASELGLETLPCIVVDSDAYMAAYAPDYLTAQKAARKELGLPLQEADEFDPREYLLRPPDKAEFVKLAVKAAELVLPVFERRFPDDERPRKAIEAAKAWLNSPDIVNAAYAYAADAAVDAANAAFDANAAYAAANAAWAAANAADAAWAAANAVDVATAAAEAAADAAVAAYAAAYAAWVAANAADAAWAAANAVDAADTTIARIGQIQDEIKELRSRIRESLEDFDPRDYLMSLPPQDFEDLKRVLQPYGFIDIAARFTRAHGNRGWTIACAGKGEASMAKFSRDRDGRWVSIGSPLVVPIEDVPKIVRNHWRLRRITETVEESLDEPLDPVLVEHISVPDWLAARGFSQAENGVWLWEDERRRLSVTQRSFAAGGGEWTICDQDSGRDEHYCCEDDYAPVLRLLRRLYDRKPVQEAGEPSLPPAPEQFDPRRYLDEPSDTGTFVYETPTLTIIRPDEDTICRFVWKRDKGPPSRRNDTYMVFTKGQSIYSSFLVSVNPDGSLSSPGLGMVFLESQLRKEPYSKELRRFIRRHIVQAYLDQGENDKAVRTLADLYGVEYVLKHLDRFGASENTKLRLGVQAAAKGNFKLAAAVLNYPVKLLSQEGATWVLDEVEDLAQFFEQRYQKAASCVLAGDEVDADWVYDNMPPLKDVIDYLNDEHYASIREVLPHRVIYPMDDHQPVTLTSQMLADFTDDDIRYWLDDGAQEVDPEGQLDDIREAIIHAACDAWVDIARDDTMEGWKNEALGAINASAKWKGGKLNLFVSWSSIQEWLEETDGSPADLDELLYSYSPRAVPDEGSYVRRSWADSDELDYHLSERLGDLDMPSYPYDAQQLTMPDVLGPDPNEYVEVTSYSMYTPHGYKAKIKRKDLERWQQEEPWRLDPEKWATYAKEQGIDIPPAPGLGESKAPFIACAVRHKRSGKVYRGPTHSLAMEDYLESRPELGLDLASLDELGERDVAAYNRVWNAVELGFVARNGRFVSQDEARRITGRDIHGEEFDEAAASGRAIAAVLLEQAYRYATTQLDVPAPQADFIFGWGQANVPDERLYFEDPDLNPRETEQHVTCVYGITVDEVPEALREITRQYKPFPVYIGKVSLFRQEKYDVVKLDVESPWLRKLHDEVAAAVPNQQNYSGYRPHLTIAYVKKGSCNDLEGADIFQGQDGTVDPQFIAYGLVFNGAGDSESGSRVRETLLFTRTKKTRPVESSPFDGVPFPLGPDEIGRFLRVARQRARRPIL